MISCVVESRFRTRLWSTLFAILLGYALGTNNAAASLGQQQRRDMAMDLRGTWTASVAGQHVVLTLPPDQTTGNYRIGASEHTFEVRNGELVVIQPDGEVQYLYKRTGNQLTLTGGDLSGPFVLTRRFDLVEYLQGGWEVTAGALWEKGYRIIFIVGVVLAARLVIAAMRAVSHAMIFWNWGPFALIYRNNKNRARTVHSLALNVLKYFVYFTALGMILSELGINYATYLASLSVVGLAIGFGSQGLVQDMVTGFFIIFEGQFDVGDMVEISGQTGHVMSIGLRMTKVRNYLGQEVVIPNRNIAVVGNYRRGGQRTYVDVPVRSEEQSKRVGSHMRRVAEQLTHQFPEVVLGPIHASDLRLETGEHFARLHLSIWPGQAWVVDRHLLPRITRVLAEHGLEPPQDQITVYYHPKLALPRNRWQAGRSWFKRRKQG